MSQRSWLAGWAAAGGLGQPGAMKWPGAHGERKHQRGNINNQLVAAALHRNGK